MPTFTGSIEQVFAKMERGFDCLEENLDEIALPVMKALEGAMTQRIHNEGKKSDGSSIGTYSARYAKYRQSKGRQTGYVDLEDTSTLRSALQTGEVNGKPVLMLNPNVGYEKSSKRAKEIAGYHEEHYGELYKPTNEEMDEVKEIVKLQLKKQVKECFR